MAIARRTTFGHQPFRVGLRLQDLPRGLAAASVIQGTADGQPSSGLILKAQDPNAEPSSITIAAFAGSATVSPGLPGFEEDRIAGHRAVLNGREMSLTLDVDGYVVRIEAPGGEPADLTRSLWPRAAESCWCRSPRTWCWPATSGTHGPGSRLNAPSPADSADPPPTG